MRPTKTPTSSLSGSHVTYSLLRQLTAIAATVIELLINRVRYRTLAEIWRIYSGGAPPETSTACPSPATRLPQEVVEIILDYLTYDTRSLHACTLTFNSWYIAAVPHLHRTLVIPTCSLHKNRKYMWPGALPYKYGLGLLPMVKTFWASEGDSDRAKFSLKLLSCCILRQFSALTNVQQLRIDNLDIPSFGPGIRRYFEHFSPVVQYLALGEPRGSRRQITYFIGLFQHLQDLKLVYDRTRFQEEPADDLTLIPPFVPPLRGRLIMRDFTRVGLFKDMIELFGESDSIT